MNLIGQHVSWEKLDGKPNASMVEKEGFGLLWLLEIGRGMRILGDHGVTTTKVESIENKKAGIVIKTKNSTYLIKSAV